jgi:carbon-monoxide dehydrogenase medium subunit
MREGRRHVGRIVDLKRIPELTTLAVRSDGSLSIGAAASLSVIARHPAVLSDYPAVAQSARLVGSLQIQNRASLGGNICNAAPSADAVPALICLGAFATVANLQGRRDIPIAELFLGPARTALEPGELLTTIVLPPLPARSAAAYVRFTPRREMDIAIAGVGAWICLDEQKTISQARIVLAAVGPTPLRAEQAEAVLIGERPTRAPTSEAGKLAAEAARPISDTRASADYRRTLVAVLTERALTDCCKQLQAQEAIA